MNGGTGGYRDHSWSIELVVLLNRVPILHIPLLDSGLLGSAFSHQISLLEVVGALVIVDTAGKLRIM